MALHQLTSVTIGIPDPDSATAFYSEFVLDARDPGPQRVHDAARQGASGGTQ